MVELKTLKEIERSKLEGRLQNYHSLGYDTITSMLGEALLHPGKFVVHTPIEEPSIIIKYENNKWYILE